MRCVTHRRYPVRIGTSAFVLALAGLAGGAVAQTTVLTGRIVSLARAPVSAIRIRVVRFGEPTVFQSGEFRIELPAGTEEVEIQSLSPAWELVYPFGGRVAVPRGEQSVVLVVGKPVEQTITDALRRAVAPARTGAAGERRAERGGRPGGRRHPAHPHQTGSQGG